MDSRLLANGLVCPCTRSGLPSTFIASNGCTKMSVALGRLAMKGMPISM